MRVFHIIIVDFFHNYHPRTKIDSTPEVRPKTKLLAISPIAKQCPGAHRAPVTAMTGLSELAAAQAGLIQLDSLDSTDDQWASGVLGNSGSSNDDFVGVEPWNGDTTLGDWGVDVQTHTVWAVLDHNSEFAVVPEPSTLTVLGAGAMGLIGFAWRRMRSKRIDSTVVPVSGPKLSGLFQIQVRFV